MSSDKNASYNSIFCAIFLIGMLTPFKICSDEYSVLIDSPVLTDLNGLPIIPGTSIAGVFRKSARDSFKNEEDIKDIFGYSTDESEGAGSRLIFSHGIVIDKDGKPVINLIKNKNDFLKLLSFERFPLREKNAINGKGVAKKHSKFDEQIVPKGVRFAFEIEFRGNCESEEDRQKWSNIINLVKSDNFRLGGGSRHGFGLVKLLNFKENVYRLNVEEELKNYLDREFLAESEELFNNVGKGSFYIDINKNTAFKEYALKLKPRDFFIFSSGFTSEDTDADMTPLKEVAITYDTDKSDKIYYIIPASSIKGAISHRVAYHYNYIKGNFAENYTVKDDNCIGEGEIEDLVSPNNQACKVLFGSKKEKKGSKAAGEKSNDKAGNVFFEDIFIEETDGKIVKLHHVSIDRFTGKSIDGALFSEEVLQLKKDSEITIKFFVKKEVIDSDKDIEKALSRAIFDIENGLLPLGGGVNRGHGIFMKAE